VCESPIPLILPVSYNFWNQQRKEEGEKEDSKKEKGRKKKIHAHKASIVRANTQSPCISILFCSLKEENTK
jgi:hypothetical protein